MSPRKEADEALLGFAAEVGDTDPVAIAGGRTGWDVGGELPADTRILAAPAGVLDHKPEEMTVSVRAGTLVADLHAALAEAGQRTGLPERGGTVGGALSVGYNHLDVLSRGRVREALLQVTYVSAEGRIVTGGGPTVKNVSGFDLPRLVVGSLGTIGLVAEVILRTNPIPDRSVWLTAEDADPFAVPGVVLRPGAVLWDGGRTWVHLEGYEADVVADQKRLDPLGRWAVTAGPPDLPAHRWSLAPSQLQPVLAASGLVGPWVASVGVGTVWASSPQVRPAPSPALVILSRRVKEQFDPTGRLNPGRDPLAVSLGAPA
jgi:FAD/FMN-containing dehydrogenase